MFHARTPDPPFRSRRPSRALLPVLLVGALLVQACADEQNPVDEPAVNAPDFDLEIASASEIGDVLPGTDLAEFEEAEDAFGEVETISDGLGPTFNEAA